MSAWLHRLNSRLATGCAAALLCAAAFVSCGDPGEDLASTESRDSAAAARLEAPAVMEARVDQARVKMGDPVTLTVEVRHDANVDVELPAVLDVFENALIKGAGLWSPFEAPGDRRGQRCSVTLDPGIGPIVVIPPFTLRWRLRPDDEAAEGEDWTEETSDPITVEVDAVTADDAELIEPLEGFELPEPKVESKAQDDWRLLAAVGGGLVLLAGLVVFLFREKKRRAIVPPTPDEVARRELSRLGEMGLLDRGEFREYYYRLTAILRRYIEDRFGLMAPERTTEEFLAEMRNDPAIPAAEQETLASFLASADLVKYARAEPPRDESQRATETARRFIESTRAVGEGGPHVDLR